MTTFVNYIRNLPLGSTTLGQALSNLSSALTQMSQTHVSNPQMQPIIHEFLEHPEKTFQEIPVSWQADAGVVEFYAVALRCRNQIRGHRQYSEPRFGGNPVLTTSHMTLEWCLYQLLRRINSPRLAGIQLDYGQRFGNLVQPLTQILDPTPNPVECEMDPLTSTPSTTPTTPVVTENSGCDENTSPVDQVDQSTNSTPDESKTQ